MLTDLFQRRWQIALVVALVGGAAVWTTVSNCNANKPADEPTLVEIEQVLARPSSFVGKAVRLKGQLSECVHWECSLCPEKAKKQKGNPDRCLALSFRPLVHETGFGSNEQEALFRFSSVEVTATFDPTCNEQGACLDRQSVLLDAQVVDVIERRSSAAGLWLGDTTKLTQIDEANTKPLKLAAIRAGFPDGVSIRAFSVETNEDRKVVCWSPVGMSNSDLGAWPQTLESALYAQSTLDFFSCNEAKSIDGVFVLQVRH